MNPVVLVLREQGTTQKDSVCVYLWMAVFFKPVHSQHFPSLRQLNDN